MLYKNIITITYESHDFMWSHKEFYILHRNMVVSFKQVLDAIVQY